MSSLTSEDRTLSGLEPADASDTVMKMCGLSYVRLSLLEPVRPLDKQCVARVRWIVRIASLS